MMTVEDYEARLEMLRERVVGLLEAYYRHITHPPDQTMRYLRETYCEAVVCYSIMSGVDALEVSRTAQKAVDERKKANDEANQHD